MASKVKQSGVGHHIDLVVAGDPRHELVAREQLRALMALVAPREGIQSRAALKTSIPISSAPTNSKENT